MLLEAAWVGTESKELLLTVAALTFGTVCLLQSPVLGFCPGQAGRRCCTKTTPWFSTVNSLIPVVLDPAAVERSFAKTPRAVRLLPGFKGCSLLGVCEAGSFSGIQLTRFVSFLVQTYCFCDLTMLKCVAVGNPDVLSASTSEMCRFESETRSSSYQKKECFQACFQFTSILSFCS